MQTVRWGIMATGRIAHSFARDLMDVPGAELTVVGSRRLESATAFAHEYGARAVGSYAEVATAPDVDVVYVASPHSEHLANASLAIEAGKAVLCEKPLTLNAREAGELIDLAQTKGVFLMEAMWMACHPVIRQIQSQLRDGRFGHPRVVRAELGFKVDFPPDSRMLNPALGAGALLDMGIYPLTFAELMLGPVLEQVAIANIENGIDFDVAISGRHEHGAISSLVASMTADNSATAQISTAEGIVEVPAPFHHPGHALWRRTDAAPIRIESPEPVIGSGLGNEALHVGECLRAGLLESPLVPHAHTLSMMRQMDALRAQLGVRYPADDTDPRSAN